MKITLLPYESCLKIGEELIKNQWGHWFYKDYGLPREVFGQTFKVNFFDNEGYFTISGKYCGCYYVPAIFVSYVSHGS